MPPLQNSNTVVSPSLVASPVTARSIKKPTSSSPVLSVSSTNRPRRMSSRDRSFSDSSRGSCTTVGSSQLSARSIEIRIQKHMQKYGRHHSRVGKLWNALGIHQFRSSKLPEASDAFKQAIMCERGPHTPTAFLNLGTIYWSSLGDVNEAIRYLQQAQSMYQLDPAEQAVDLANATHQLGLCFALKTEYSRSLEYLTDALYIHEKHADISKIGVSLNAIGKVYCMSGDLDSALETYQRALKVRNESGTSNKTLLFNIASCYMQKKNYRSALFYLNELVRTVDIAEDKELRLSALQMAQSAHRELGQHSEAFEYENLARRLQ